MDIDCIIESILFAAGRPVKIKTLSDVLNISTKDVIESFNRLKNSYDRENRGVKVSMINDSIVMSSNEAYSDYIKKALGLDIKQGLSQAALEVLSIIAYNQPITRIDIEKIRGVKCEKAINTLLEFNLIKEDGRINAPGRAILYSTTDDFLKYFNLPSLKDLPPLDDIT
ncbi:MULTISPECIES: SMC-Scp complex subunit ScpB [unclassified Thermoanaerobacterium]|uniref:SMC-Scp complex subunit ScpB n=1 Tax=unclassified Thermoanaerobacterium TaxID=2622527 RepID=UPI000A147C1D|nr:MULTISPECIES: SMC-Scp complex subunit ScpB [unclassified Thermoanaerobacterium]MDE4541730.1 SMC-Scp complex subunit ScpB [Thermoanaerobacterium sp. R66]ORX24138.1 SMC-Scp complex subunit ScpB [Thermoanaerobacterium sp. PSU-2]HHV73701.1 SMC-Scp complex subunit ScpB [Thermoanaerobacterium sp.]